MRRWPTILSTAARDPLEMRVRRRESGDARGNQGDHSLTHCQALAHSQALVLVLGLALIEAPTVLQLESTMLQLDMFEL